MVDKLREAGEKMQAIGCLLFIVFSVPLFLAILFGQAGLVVGVIISLVILGTSIKKR